MISKLRAPIASSLSLLLGVASIGIQPEAHAQVGQVVSQENKFVLIAEAREEQPVTKENDTATTTRRTASATYWTPERLRKAKPLVPQTTKAVRRALSPATARRNRTRISRYGKSHMIQVRPTRSQLFRPFTRYQALTQRANVGTSPTFTSSQVVPLSANLAYRYIRVSKRFYIEPVGSDFMCSASVLGPRMILTAGRCVHRQQPGGLYTRRYLNRATSKPLRLTCYESEKGLFLCKSIKRRIPRF